jgi:hypothetical protein
VTFLLRAFGGRPGIDSAAKDWTVINKLGLAVLVLALGILLVWSRSERPGVRGTEAPRSGIPETDETPEKASLALAAAPGETQSKPAREEVAAGARMAEELARGPGATVGARDRFRLSGTLLHSSDHRPAADAALVFRYGEESTRAATDEAGRFATEPVVPPGAVQVGLDEAGATSDSEVLLDIEPAILLAEPGTIGGRLARATPAVRSVELGRVRG